jgi:hypothetical protein
MVIVFTKKYLTRSRKYFLYVSDDYEELGDKSVLFPRVGSEISEYDELILISLSEYEFLKKNLKETVRDYE